MVKQKMIFNLFKKKSPLELEIKSHEKGFKEATRIMQNVLDDERAEHRRRQKEQNKKHQKALDELRVELENNFGERLSELLKQNNKLCEQIKKNRKAWNMYKNFVPEVLSIAHILKSDAFGRMEESISKYNRIGNHENEIEHISRKLDDLSPKIQSLLEGDIDVEKIIGSGETTNED